jgi:small subunit ribosomal protein S9
MAEDEERPEQPSAEDASAEAPTPDAAEQPTAPESNEAEVPAAAEAPPEEPAAAEEAAPAEEPAPAVAEEPATEEEPAPVAAEAEPEAEEPAAEPAPAVAEGEEPAPADEAAPEQPRRQRPPRPDEDEQPAEPAVVPGAHLEPDLVLEEKRPAEGEFDPYASDDDVPVAEGEDAATVEEAPAPARTVLDLAADARYRATGKRKRAIARVILKPGAGVYMINGKELDTYFPRVTLQKNARLPLETAGYETRMDVVAKIHGGGVSSQAIALRHGIARALVEADPALRGELKRHGFLTRDARVKERKKAGLKKARKRPQFSKR